MIRHLVTGEYPPQPGGVADYSELIAHELAAGGDEVHVWCPQAKSSELEQSGKPRANERTDVSPANVHREFGRLTIAGLARTGRLLDQYPKPRFLLVQWVPHSYGYRSMNVSFCLWLWWRAKLKRDRIELMVHEPFLAFREGSRKQDIAAAVHRLMMIVLLSAARRVWVSIPQWESLLRPYSPRRKETAWLPVPSNISIVEDEEGISSLRAAYAAPGALLLGHFGAYDHHLNDVMSELLPKLLTSARQVSVLLIGKGSLELRHRLIDQNPDLASRLRATGALTKEDVSRHVSACDVMLQPYADGVSGRRTSVMTALAHGVPVVTTRGKATEEVWLTSRAVVLAEVGNINALLEATKSLLVDEEQKRLIGRMATSLYRDLFAVEHTVSALRGDIRRSEGYPPALTTESNNARVN